MTNEIQPIREGEIVLYQPDENIKLEVKLDANRDTVWLTKRQMAELFGRNRTTISRHITNTFEQGEVDPKMGCAFFAQTTRHGAIEGKTHLKKHNEQYPEIKYVQLPHRKHDRYLIIDDVVYMLGDSLKNMGDSLTAIIRTEMTPNEVMSKLN